MSTRQRGLRHGWVRVIIGSLVIALAVQQLRLMRQDREIAALTQQEELRREFAGEDTPERDVAKPSREAGPVTERRRSAGGVASGDPGPDVVVVPTREVGSERKGLDKIVQLRDRAEFSRIGTAVDALVDDGVVDDEVASDVEFLLQDEALETWNIKEAVRSGDLTSAQGVADWRTLVADTDRALLDLLDEATVDDLRAAVASAGKD